MLLWLLVGFLVYFFETGFLRVSLAVLNLILLTRPALNS